MGREEEEEQWRLVLSIDKHLRDVPGCVCVCVGFRCACACVCVVHE